MYQHPNIPYKRRWAKPIENCEIVCRSGNSERSHSQVPAFLHGRTQAFPWNLDILSSPFQPSIHVKEVIGILVKIVKSLLKTGKKTIINN